MGATDLQPLNKKCEWPRGHHPQTQHHTVLWNVEGHTHTLVQVVVPELDEWAQFGADVRVGPQLLAFLLRRENPSPVESRNWTAHGW